MDKDKTWSVTIDPVEIKLWAEAHKGKPELLNSEEAGSDEYVLRFDFPGRKDNVFLGETPLERKITWDKFFDIFTQKNLAFEYQKDYIGDHPDMAYRFVLRDSIKEKSFTLGITNT